MRDTTVFILVALAATVSCALGDVVSPARAPTASAPSVDLDVHSQRALAMAIAKWRGEDFREAGIDLVKLINMATPDRREAMSAWVQTLLGMSLAELAADVHWRAAMAARRRPGIRMGYVTDYEKPTLIARMTVAYEAALREKGQTGLAGRIDANAVAVPRHRAAASRANRAADVAGKGDGAVRSGGKSTAHPWYEALPSASQPASQPAGLDRPDTGADYAVIDWMGRPEQFNGSTTQAKWLVGRTAYALSILNERLRLEPEVNRSAELKRQLLLDKKRLAALSKMLSARIAHPNRFVVAPQAVEAKRAWKEEQRKNWEEQQKAQAEEVRKAQEEARKWQAEQEKQAERKPGLFDWLKPKPADEKK